MGVVYPSHPLSLSPSFYPTFCLSLPLLPPSPNLPLQAESKAAAAVPRHSGSSGGSSGAPTAVQQGQPSPPQIVTPSHPQAQFRPPISGGMVGEHNNPVNGAAVHPFPVVSRIKHSMSTSSGFTSVSQQNLRGGQPAMPPDRVSVRSLNVLGAHGGGLGVPGNLGNSRESFQEALDNPCEYFIDVM